MIDRVVIEPGSEVFKIGTIGNKTPVGICGSGLIDLVAQLFQAGMIDMRGKFVENKCGDRLKSQEGMKHLIIVDSGESPDGNDLTISQADIDALIRSKAAMYTILTTITQMVRIPLQDIRHFFISGTFGIYKGSERAGNVEVTNILQGNADHLGDGCQDCIHRRF